jgi:superfamily I DNA/RNA helicase
MEPIVKPTGEQEAILNSNGRVIRINARAGTGKTTTLVMLAEKNHDKRALYLVFNRKAREAAQQRLPANVQVHTVHSLAYRSEGYRWKGSLGGFSPVDMLPAFGKDKIAHHLAGISHQFLTFFLNSPYTKLEDATSPFGQHLTPEQSSIFEKHEERIIQASRDIATAWNRREKPCPHDFYLKLFHKSGQFHKELDRYDMILVDEAQDLSPVMIDAIEKCRKRIVLVGDSHQQIYGFRYAVDAMRRVNCDEELQLTLSFRFGSPIAELASLFIQEAKKDKNFRIRGNPEKTSTVSLSSRPPSRKDDATRAILTRTNPGLFSNAMQLRSEGKAFHFERDLQGVLMRTLDVYRLFRGQKDKIRDVFIGSFDSLQQLEEYSESMNDFPLAGMAQIVKKYGDDSFPSAVFEMSKATRNGNAADRPAGVTLSTIHTAKGQEYDEVYIDRDIAENLGVAVHNGPLPHEEEVNVAYVGFTRAIKRLHLPSVFQTMLSDKWKAHVSGRLGKATAEATVVKLAGAAEKPMKSSIRKQKIFGGLRREREESNGGASIRAQVGDTVQTPHGPGKIVAISGEKCLLELENQEARLWERL